MYVRAVSQSSLKWPWNTTSALGVLRAIRASEPPADQDVLPTTCLEMQSRDRLIDYAAHEGAAIVRQIVADHPELDAEDVRQRVILFSVFVNAIQRLHLQGFSERELVSEVFEHCELARFIQAMNNPEADDDAE